MHSLTHSQANTTDFSTLKANAIGMKRHFSERRDLCGCRKSFDVGVVGRGGCGCDGRESSGPAHEHVDKGVLDERREDERQTDDQPGTRLVSK